MNALSYLIWKVEGLKNLPSSSLRRIQSKPTQCINLARSYSVLWSYRFYGGTSHQGTLNSTSATTLTSRANLNSLNPCFKYTMPWHAYNVAPSSLLWLWQHPIRLRSLFTRPTIRIAWRKMAALAFYSIKEYAQGHFTTYSASCMDSPTHLRVLRKSIMKKVFPSPVVEI
jgi:hypothetical protein